MLPLREPLLSLISSSEPVTLIAIGPMPNVAAALTREPRIAEKTRLVGIYGSVHRGYDGITITPLDTCGLVTLDGDQYKRIIDSKDPIPAKIIENYRIWSKAWLSTLLEPSPAIE